MDDKTKLELYSLHQRLCFSEHTELSHKILNPYGRHGGGIIMVWTCLDGSDSTLTEHGFLFLPLNPKRKCQCGGVSSPALGGATECSFEPVLS